MSEQPGRVLRAAGHAAGTAAQKVVTFAGKAGRLLSPSPALARHAGFGTSQHDGAPVYTCCVHMLPPCQITMLEYAFL